MEEEFYPPTCSILVVLNFKHSDPVKHADKPSCKDLSSNTELLAPLHFLQMDNQV